MSTYIEYVHARPEFEEILFQLAKAFNFTASDLESNRAGRVGFDQIRFHIREALFVPCLVLLLGVMASFVVRVAFAWYVEKRSGLKFAANILSNLLLGEMEQFRDSFFLTAGERLPIIVALFVITAPGLAYKRLRSIPFRLLLDILLGRVKQAEGTVNVESKDVKAPGRAGRKGEMITLYYYLVGDLKFVVSYEAFTSLSLGIRYRVYYLPKSKAVMSVEPVL